MAPPSWAYQVDNFSPPPDEELVCSICQAVFCDPVQSPCNHVFCRSCIIKWLESNRNCPICRKRTTRSTLQEVVPIVKNMIMKLTLICHNSSRGCNEKFSLESSESHIKDCPYELVQCKNKPCNLMFMKRDLNDHEVNSCPHSFIKCTSCKLKMPSRKPKVHNCVTELQKKLKEKNEKLKKSNEKMKKLKEELKRLKSRHRSSGSSSSDSLSAADVLFRITEHDLSGSSTVSSYSDVSDSGEEDDNMWSAFQGGDDVEIDYQLSRIDDIYSSESPYDPTDHQPVNESTEYPRSSSPANRLSDSSIIEVGPFEAVLDDESQIRRPQKRRLTARILDSTDEENEEGNSSLPSRKRTWPSPRVGEDEGTAAGTSSAAGPSYLTSAADSSTSTNDSSPANNRGRFKLNTKLRSRSAQQRGTSARTAAANSTAAPQNSSPVFERTISLLEQYNLESDPEWVPDIEDVLNDSDNVLFTMPGHITSSDESSLSDLESETSYEDAAEGRTEDLLNSFYATTDDSDSEEEWQPN